MQECRLGIVDIRMPVGLGVSPVEPRPPCVLVRAVQNPSDHFFLEANKSSLQGAAGSSGGASHRSPGFAVKVPCPGRTRSWRGRG